MVARVMKKASCKQAALGGHLDCLRFLFDKVKPSRDTEEEVAMTSNRCWSRGDLEIYRRRKKDI